MIETGTLRRSFKNETLVINILVKPLNPYREEGYRGKKRELENRLNMMFVNSYRNIEI